MSIAIEERPAAARLGRVLAILAALMLASAYVATAFAMRSFSPISAAMWRGLLSAALIGAYLVVRDHGVIRLPDWPAGVRLLVLGCTGGLGLVVAMNVSISLAGATAASFYVALASVIAAGLAPLVLRERLRLPAIAGLALAVAGTAALTGLQVSDPDALLGALAGLGGAVSFGLFLVLSRRWVEPFRLSNGAVALAITGSAGLALLGFALATGGSELWPREVRLDALAGLAWLALVPGVAAQLLLVATARRLRVTTSASLLLIKPVFTGILSVILLSENLTFLQLAGAALILLGIALSELRSTSPRAAPTVAVQPGA